MESKREPKSIQIEKSAIKNEVRKMIEKRECILKMFAKPAHSNVSFFGPNKLPKVDYLPVGNLLKRKKNILAGALQG